MIGKTIPRYETYESTLWGVTEMPPYPIYIVEFEQYEEVERLRNEIGMIQFNFPMYKFPQLTALHIALGNITESLDPNGGEETHDNNH